MNDPRFLEVVFGDNDFGIPMEAALSRLWGYVHENNAHLVSVAPRSIPWMFVGLHEAGVLKGLVDRLFILETLCLDVEHSTRGLYWETVDLKKHALETEVIDAKRYESYLNCDLSFHVDNLFTIGGQNGECACLDLTTGYVEIY